MFLCSHSFHIGIQTIGSSGATITVFWLHRLDNGVVSIDFFDPNRLTCEFNGCLLRWHTVRLCNIFHLFFFRSIYYAWHGMMKRARHIVHTFMARYRIKLRNSAREILKLYTVSISKSETLLEHVPIIFFSSSFSQSLSSLSSHHSYKT